MVKTRRARERMASSALSGVSPAVPRQSANTGGMVVDMFRDAANDLDLVEDEWRYGARDAVAQESNEPIVIDLDEAA